MSRANENELMKNIAPSNPREERLANKFITIADAARETFLKEEESYFDMPGRSGVFGTKTKTTYYRINGCIGISSCDERNINIMNITLLVVPDQIQIEARTPETFFVQIIPEDGGLFNILIKSNPNSEELQMTELYIMYHSHEDLKDYELLNPDKNYTDIVNDPKELPRRSNVITGERLRTITLKNIFTVEDLVQLADPLHADKVKARV